MAKRPLMSGNWKMYMNTQSALELVKALKGNCADVEDRDILVFVPFTLLAPVVNELKGSNIWVGAQNMYFEKEGAFTGEISPAHLLDIGVEWVLLGHSERRHVFGETNDLINKKIKSALASNLKPVLCVGELLEERENGKIEEVLKTQTKGGFKDLTKDEAKKVVIAYEPVWAIGTGKTASPEDADEAHKIIRKILEQMYDKEVADNMRILYGGSVKPDNVDGLMAKPNVDGSLVGGASLKADGFTRIVKFQ
ncbi:MAG: triose-phosphate isomerase [Spirochaetes bacterium GWF1_51_8]|nr:MAG: triose-phosphate isomerase [Spirochaetes bacterium GWF1_51_8]